MQCILILPPNTLRGSGFMPNSTLIVPVGGSPEERSQSQGYKITHRARGEPSYGSGAYYSMRSPGLLSTKKSRFVSSFSCDTCSPVDPSNWSQRLTTETSCTFPTTPDSAAGKKGASYQAGWCIRDGYVVAVSCYNFKWYPWRYSVAVAPVPDEVEITTKSGIPYVKCPGWYGKGTGNGGWLEENQATQSTFMDILFNYPIPYILSQPCMTGSWNGMICLSSFPVWEPKQWGSTTPLSEAVWNDGVPSCYMKAVSTAYYSAMEHIPSLSLNPLTALSDLKSLANIKLNLLRSSSVLKGAAGDYLQYRYGIKTAQMDLEDLDAAEDRLRAILKAGLVCDGYATASDGTHVHVTLKYDCSTTADMFIWSSPLKRLLQRGLVDLWDVIPFSFIVDWFFDVEKYLTDVGNLTLNEIWSPTEVWVSFFSTSPGVAYEYARVHGYASLASTALGYSDYEATTSNRGIAYHIADGLAIVTQLFG